MLLLQLTEPLCPKDENSFQSKVYSTHTKQRLVSQAVVVEYILKRTISTRKLRTMITGQSVSLKVGKGFC